MEDETEIITSSASEFTDSFVASDDDDLENGLNWDSEDSRPAAPSPPSTPSQNMSLSQNIRSRLRPRLRRLAEEFVAERHETQSDSDSSVENQISAESNQMPLPEDYASSDELTIDDDHDTSDNSSLTSDHFVGGYFQSPSSPDSSDLTPEYSPESPTYRPGSVSNSPIVPHTPENAADVEQEDVNAQQGDVNAEQEDVNAQQEDLDAQPEDVGSPDPHVPVIESPVQEVNADVLQENQPNNVLTPLQITTAEAQSNPTVSASNQIEGPGVADISVLSEGDDASLCSICMDPLTNSGEHRIVCLKCGHIFGNSCLERWIKVGCNNGARRCPTCNKKACLKDIRILYLPKVVPLDTVEKDRLIQEKEEVAAQKRVLEMQLARCKLQYDMSTKVFEEKIKVLEKKYEEAQAAIELLSQGKTPRLPGPVTESGGGGFKLALTHSVEIRKEGGCRVMAYNAFTQQLVVSQQSGNTVFAGFGVRLLPSVDFQPTRFLLLHQKMIRDLAFHPEDRDLLLSVSLDQTAKLVDLASSSTVHTFKGDGPLWSCCWEASNPHLLLVGSQLGKVRQYDRRMMDHYLNLWEHSYNTTPVVALASAPCVASTLFPQGGFFSCRLNGVFAYSRHGDKYNHQELSLDGPFMSMRYDHRSQTLLTSSRPSSRSAHAKVNLNLIDVDAEGKLCTPQIHTFNCGSSARVLSRLATLSVPEDSLVVAHHESGRTVNMWSTKSGNLVHSCPIKEPVIDMTAIPLYNKCLLSTLSDKRVNIYKVA